MATVVIRSPRKSDIVTGLFNRTGIWMKYGRERGANRLRAKPAHGHSEL
mgnify:CR=1 FL=1